MIGRWEGIDGESRLEEIWSPPNGNIMMGMFRLVQVGVPSFYEFMLLKPGVNGLRLHIKHFSLELVSWEEKESSVSFDLVEINGREAVFCPQASGSSGWAVYRIADDGWLEFVEIGEEETVEPGLHLRFAPATLNPPTFPSA